jgi:16S rRNA (adenine1518-N6/adenine1519-N6)-dimethyltransferase
MDLSQLHDLKSLLQRYGLWAKKQLGQNFLVNQNSLAQIVKAAELKSTDTVLEVGPGPGVLTRALLEKANHVIAVELDSDFLPILQDLQKESPELELIQANILNYLPPQQTYKLVANIPYYLTAKLLRHFLEEVPYKPSLLVLLVQKEVANKILSSKMNLLTLSVRVYATAEIIASVPASHFYPQPKVDSAILRLKLHQETPLKSDPGKLFKLARTAFAGKRKQLKNTLATLHIPAQVVQEILQELGHSEKARPEELSLQDWDYLNSKLETYL